MLRSRHAIALAIGAVLAVGPAHAERFTADQAVAHALAHNPELKAGAAEAGAAEAQVTAAAAERLPRLDLQYSARRSDSPLDAFAYRLQTRQVTAADFDPARLNDPLANTLHTTEVALLWPVYTGGRITAGIDAARAQAAAAQHGLQRAREQVAYRTQVAYLTAQAAAEAVRIHDAAVEAAQRHANTTGRLLRERRIVSSDKLTADVNLALIQANRERAATRARDALAQLRLVMGLAPGTTLELDPWREPTAPSDATAARERADIKAQAARAQAARERITAARGAYQPQVSVGAARTWYDDRPALDNGANSIMGVVSLNLYGGGRDQAGVAAAQLQAEADAARLEALRQQAALETDMARNALDEARARVEICADNVGKAARTVELVQGRYGEGRTILIDLLQAERALVEARMEKLNAGLNLATATLGVALATGTLELPQ
ncbi:MAG: TolC family protein [Gammaproteobacteria bacterium]